MSKRLTIRALTDAQMTAMRGADLFERLEQSHELQVKIKLFEAVVWFPRLQTQVNGTDQRGMIATVRGIKIMTWCCAGRCMIQMERDGATVTLITADDEKPWQRDLACIAPNMGPMGLQGIDAEYFDALKMLYEATRYGSEIDLRPDANITIGM